jgi:hypothetical protein
MCFRWGVGTLLHGVQHECLSRWLGGLRGCCCVSASHDRARTCTLGEVAAACLHVFLCLLRSLLTCCCAPCFLCLQVDGQADWAAEDSPPAPAVKAGEHRVSLSIDAGALHLKAPQASSYRPCDTCLICSLCVMLCVPSDVHVCAGLCM